MPPKAAEKPVEKEKNVEKADKAEKVEKNAPERSAEDAKLAAARMRDLDAAISSITKAYGDGSIMRLGDAHAARKILAGTESEAVRVGQRIEVGQGARELAFGFDIKRTDDHDVPIRPFAGDVCHQSEIHFRVDGADVTEPRMGNGRQVLRFGSGRLGKEFLADSVRHEHDVPGAIRPLPSNRFRDGEHDSGFP